MNHEGALKIGLTGGIGAGKSTVSARFAALGAQVLDADLLSRAALAPGGDCVSSVTDAFGKGILREDGRIDRDKLAAIVFSCESQRQRLNAILHPYVLEKMFSAYDSISHSCPNAVVIFDIPLLIECGAHFHMHRNAAVTANETLRIERIRQRSGLTETQARARIASQIPESIMLSYIDDVIDNSGTLSSLYERVDALYRFYQAEAGA